MKNDNKQCNQRQSGKFLLRALRLDQQGSKTTTTKATNADDDVTTSTTTRTQESLLSKFNASATAATTVTDEKEENAANGVDAATVEIFSLEKKTTKKRGQRVMTLKDLMWVREALEDLTAAQFAMAVEQKQRSSQSDDDASAAEKVRSTRKRAVDYEKILTALDKRLDEIGCPIAGSSNSTIGLCSLSPNAGMGSIVYTETQRVDLLEQLLRARQQLVEYITANDVSSLSSRDLLLSSVPRFPPDMALLPQLPKENVGLNGTDDGSPKLYVRDDGTVDWDGALQDQAAVREFGTAVWARINGRDPKTVNTSAVEPEENHPPAKEVMAKIADTPAIVEARERLKELKEELVAQEQNLTRVLNSAIAQGQATANVRLASIAPQLRTTIQSMQSRLDTMKTRVSYQTLVYELERIYTYLSGELGRNNPTSTGYIPLQDRLYVAEFGLLESQIDAFEDAFVDMYSSAAANGASLAAIDEDVLAVVYDQLTDFKRRLGIDYYVTGLSFDREVLRRYIQEVWSSTQTGLAFYVKGIRLFSNDIVFCLRLINRAAQGYTLKPREVRNLRYVSTQNDKPLFRANSHLFLSLFLLLFPYVYLPNSVPHSCSRTFKDIITFIPFVIILIIPLTPIGHVLVFGAIQRFFPDFFPSCFTETRQNLLQLYETAEYTEFTINESWQVRRVVSERKMVGIEWLWTFSILAYSHSHLPPSFWCMRAFIFSTTAKTITTLRSISIFTGHVFTGTVFQSYTNFEYQQHDKNR